MANVRIIPATAPVVSAQFAQMTDILRRVAGYARVSTDKDEQENSFSAQVDYYTKLINGRDDWTMVSVYTDEGLSGLSTKRREGFNRMIADALDGKIDLIVTKSISRFARNTVDTLSTVRELKDKGVEVWFQKENIYTLDAKGELLISIMSSLAQEESRSISQNVTWGQRKRMADGKVTLPYKQFLGYEKGEDGKPVVNEQEAAVVRLIYRLFMEGRTFSSIAKELGERGIPSPAGKPTWQTATVRSILTNEKMKGEALMQKTYCADFLKKKMVKNTGQVEQFYVTESHPAIITPEEFDEVQAEIERRKSLGRPATCNSIFATKFVCGECGGWYGRKTWSSYRGDKKYLKTVWQCNEKYGHLGKPGRYCKTPTVSEDEVKERFLRAFNRLMVDRDALLEDCRSARELICGTESIDAELAEVRRELEVVTELSRKAIFENARVAQNQKAFAERNGGYLERHKIATERAAALEQEKQSRIAKRKALERFIADIEHRPLAIGEFDEKLWSAVVDRVTIAVDGKMTFRFKDGSEITE